MDLKIQDKVAIITGGSRGIGKATALKLSNEGANIALVARNESSLKETKLEILQTSPNCIVDYFVCDTHDNTQVEKMVNAVHQKFGSIDILVNCAAMLPQESNLDNFDDKELIEQIEVKVSGYIRCAKNVAPYMKDKGWGRIVNISGLNARSSANLIGSIRNISVSSLTKNLADTLGPFGINVSVVHPGLTYTERSDQMIKNLSEEKNIDFDTAKKILLENNSIKSIITSSDIANVIAFLVSPLSKSINGDAISAGGGMKGFVYY
jgi:NAD(P)-dependent dehydrogenase (short-subunit alcohol dehydrogenase family)